NGSCDLAPLMRTRSALGVLKAATDLTSPLIEFVTPKIYMQIRNEKWNMASSNWQQTPDFYVLLPDDEDSTNGCTARRGFPTHGGNVIEYTVGGCENPDRTETQAKWASLIACYIRASSGPVFSLLSHEESYKDCKKLYPEIFAGVRKDTPEEKLLTAHLESWLAEMRRFILIIVTDDGTLTAAPSAYVSFSSNGKRYSIANEDETSKRNFALISELMSIMAIPAQTTQPTPTIGVGPH
ncbi:MAG TPA: hypothetical protein VEK12_12535, partial [Alphaproteobacteria bacterium]|nr:hypothetical protein [Alphaproteobacteria bacterium]